MSGRLRVLLLLCCFCVFGVQAEEVIQAYDVRLQVEPNGEVLVTERIAVVAEGKAIVRGIFRDIPTRYGLGKGLLRNTPLTLISATRDGQPETSRSRRWIMAFACVWAARTRDSSPAPISTS
ncbi:DUF2207 domain-containing protein [Ectopseudomonas mendocina]|uniref:DUF2207 domain-containing protein n=1 Tax=Ectopseudomonas mendocina TaxID=300 RepID=UPI0021B101E6|nr:DUF2207 domain-containing protein [Pseudomonas mendocina]